MDHTERRARAICASENEVWEEASQSDRYRWLEEARNRDLMAEITQLRAELAEANGRIALRDGECQAKAGIIADLERDLAAERELADRLASAASNMKRAAALRGNVGFPQMDAALTAHATRRNK